VAVAHASPAVRQALNTLQGRVRQRLAGTETIVETIRDTRREPAAELPLTDEHLAAVKAAEDAIAGDERFEHLAPARDLILEFAADSAADRQADHVKPFMERHGQDISSRVCYFGIESLRVSQAAELAGIRLLPPDHPEIPTTNPLFKLDPSITSFAAVPVTGTNTVLMAARTRKLAEHALRFILRDHLSRTAAQPTTSSTPVPVRDRGPVRNCSLVLCGYQD